MNSRDLAIVSTSAIFGALISALAFRFFSSNPKNPISRRVSSTEIAAVSRRFPGLDPFSPLKRKGYLSWDDYFMAIAFLSAERSKDPNSASRVYSMEPVDTIRRKSPHNAFTNPLPPYPRASKKYNGLVDKISWQVPSVHEFRDLPCVKNIVDKAYAEEIGLNDAVDLIYVECAAILQSRIPKKLEDPGSFVLNCKIGNKQFERSLCDLGSSVNIVPLSVAKNWGKFKPAHMTLTLADQSVRRPEGLLEDIPVKIGDRYIPAEYS